jgi:uncharacterized protein (DUF1330 family)
MSAYVIAGLAVAQPEAYAEYARGVTVTLEPYGGRFIVRGGALAVIEGDWPASRTEILAFPGVDQDRAWYESAAYREIPPIRKRNARMQFVVVVEGVA